MMRTVHALQIYSRKNLRISQHCPLYPGRHWQVNPPMLFDIHCPPFKHGLGVQASPKNIYIFMCIFSWV